MGWIFSESWRSTARLDGRTAVVTGSNTGVGYHTALDLYKRGGRVILACRNKLKATEAAERIQEACVGVSGVGEVSVVELDLASLQSVRSCAQQLLQQEQDIHILINNAGVVLGKRELTVDGYEKQFATNHLGHFLLTLLLLPRLIRSAPARVINVTSEPHCIANDINFEDINCEKDFFYHTVYSQTKLANILFTNELTRRLKSAGISGVTVYSADPGAVYTNLSGSFASLILPGVGWLYSYFKWMVMQSGEQGAQTTIYCAMADEAEDQSGLYYSNCKIAVPPKTTTDKAMAEKLWDLSLEMAHVDREINFFVAG